MEGNRFGDLCEDGSLAIILKLMFKEKVQFDDTVSPC
jgi:hypothetical protein